MDGIANRERVWRPNFLVTLSRRKKIFWPLVVVLVFSLFFGISLISNQNKCEYCQDTQQYLVAIETIAPGQKIFGAVQLEERPRIFQTEASVSLSPNELASAVAKVTIYKGEVLVRDRYIDGELTNIKVIAIPVADNQRPPLEPGDKVDLFATDPEPKVISREVVSRRIARGSFVFAVDERSVSVMLAEDELEIVVSALNTSDITLILVS